MNLRQARVLVTGANGFIGGHLAERLVRDRGASVRALVRSETKRTFDTGPQIESAVGDVSDSPAMRHAVEGCDAVVHCAAMQGKGRMADFQRVNVQGTINLLEAAREAGVSRFVHLSTINVHGVPPPRDANAESPLAVDGDAYSISKAEGERAAWDWSRENDLPLIVIRPGCTYGPRGEAWTLTPLRRVRRGTPVLIGNGGGMCNAVYIDNLVDLIVMVLENDAAIGNAFIGTEGRGVTWGEFYGAYARMLGGVRLRSMPKNVARAFATASEFAARLTGTPPLIAPASVEFYSHRVVFGIEKSEKMLGYSPKVGFDEGMGRTEEWLKSSRLLS